MVASETISISIGDARSSTCIVLPRDHEIVRHLQSLLPATSRATPQEPSYYYSPPASHYSDYDSQDEFFHPRSPVYSQSVAPVRPVQPPLVSHLHYRADVVPPMHPLLQRPGSLNQPAPPFVQHADIHPPAASSVGPNTGYRRGHMGKSTSTSTSKRCTVEGCDKISVSRGVCRGHGGGRRCRFEGCPKSAQSRGDFCWSHGGGHRCEVPNCMRSRTRKSKHFCMAHIGWEAVSRPEQDPAASVVDVQKKPAKPQAPHVAGQLHSARLPSLHQALQTHCAVVSPAASPQSHRGFAV